MPIISADVIDKKIYRITVTLGHGMVENIVVSDDGLYDIHYIKDCKSVNRTGRIVNVVQNRTMPNNSYILFDYSEDNSSRKERIYFYQVQVLRDITPNNAYKIAVDHGFVGSVSDWLESLRGGPGKDNYEIALDCGFQGTREEWLESLKGPTGMSAYDIAVQNGFEGTEEEWLKSLQGYIGEDGDSAYKVAVKNGFIGTEQEWLESLRGPSGLNAYEIAVQKYGFEGTEEEWMAKFGDVSALQGQVNVIKTNLEWIKSMDGNTESSGA